jgi:hypothetical protein
MAGQGDPAAFGSAQEGRLDPQRARDLKGRGHQPWIRRVALCLMLALLGLALADVFGQRSVTRTAAGAQGSLSVYAPSALRGGLLFTSRFDVVARRSMAKPTLVLDRGWFEQMTLNGIGPNPSQQTSREGRVALTFDKLDAGRRLVVWISWQVNPTDVGRRAMGVALDDGATPIASVHRDVTIFP